MTRTRKLLGFSVIFGFGLSGVILACGGGNENLPPPPPPPPPPPVASAPPVASSAEEPKPAPPPAPPVTLTAGAASPDPAPLPTVKFATPAKGQVVPADKAADFAVKLDVKNWQTATGSSHVHLILDNKPYKAVYDPKVPVKLSELTAAGDVLAEGQHVLVAFPSRPNHESVKTKGALAIIEFYVGKKGTATVDLAKPMLIYSRPKGEYKGEMANHVLVDFQLANDTLVDGKDHVHIAVTGPGIDKELTAHDDKFGTPYYLDNLQNGSYTVKLELVGADNNALPGVWNSTTRTIKIDHDAVAEPMPGMNMGASMGDAGAPVAPAPTGSAKPKPKPAPGPMMPAPKK